METQQCGDSLALQVPGGASQQPGHANSSSIDMGNDSQSSLAYHTSSSSSSSSRSSDTCTDGHVHGGLHGGDLASSNAYAAPEHLFYAPTPAALHAALRGMAEQHGGVTPAHARAALVRLVELLKRSGGNRSRSSRSSPAAAAAGDPLSAESQRHAGAVVRLASSTLTPWLLRHSARVNAASTSPPAAPHAATATSHQPPSPHQQQHSHPPPTPDALASVACALVRLRQCDPKLGAALVGAVRACAGAGAGASGGGGSGGSGERSHAALSVGEWQPWHASGLLWALGRLHAAHADAGMGAADAQLVQSLLAHVDPHCRGRSSSGLNGPNGNGAHWCTATATSAAATATANVSQWYTPPATATASSSSNGDGSSSGSSSNSGSSNSSSSGGGLSGAPTVAATTPPVVVQALYGCALLRHAPPSDWLDPALVCIATAAQQCSRPATSGAGADSGLHPDHATAALWALATLRTDPGRPFVTAVLRCVEARTSEWGGAAGPSCTLWALAVLQHAPDAGWLEHVLWQVQRTLRLYGPQQLSMVTWALATLRYRPHRAWLREFVRVAANKFEAGLAPRVGSGGAHQRSDGSGAHPAHGGASPPPQTPATAAAVAAAPPAPRAAPASPQSVANFLWSLARLRLSPHSLALRRIIAAVQPSLTAFPPRDLTHVLWACQRLRVLPPDDWLCEAQLSMHARITQFDAPCIIMALSALGGFSRVSSFAARAEGRSSQVDARLAAALCERLQVLSAGASWWNPGESVSLSLPSTATLLLALSRLRLPIPQEQHMALLAHVSYYLDDMPPRQLPGVCRALARLAHDCSDSMQLRASSELRLLPRIEALTLPLLTLHAHAHAMPSHLGGSGGGGSVGRPHPGQHTHAGVSGGGATRASELIMLTKAFARIPNFEPGDEWLEATEACAVRLVRSGGLKPPDAQLLLHSFSLLSYYPATLLACVRGLARASHDARMARMAASAIRDTEEDAGLLPLSYGAAHRCDIAAGGYDGDEGEGGEGGQGGEGSAAMKAASTSVEAAVQAS